MTEEMKGGMSSALWSVSYDNNNNIVWRPIS